MYGFGGLVQVEVEIWSGVTMAGQTNEQMNEQGKISCSAIRPWKAEMSNMKYSLFNTVGALVVITVEGVSIHPFPQVTRLFVGSLLLTTLQ